MPLSNSQILITIAAITLGTVATRFLPFILFPDHKEPPKIITYLGKVLPPAMMGLLVVYSLKNVSILNAPNGLPEFISVAVVVALHLWRRNVFLSIGVGTVLYMVLVQKVFV